MKSFIIPLMRLQINISSTLQSEIVRQAEDLRSQCKAVINRQTTTCVLNYGDLEALIRRLSGSIHSVFWC